MYVDIDALRDAILNCIINHMQSLLDIESCMLILMLVKMQF